MSDEISVTVSLFCLYLTRNSLAEKPGQMSGTTCKLVNTFVTYTMCKLKHIFRLSGLKFLIVVFRMLLKSLKNVSVYSVKASFQIVQSVHSEYHVG